MSHSSSRAKVLNTTLPLAHRASHARSCANHVAARLNITRDELFDLVRLATGTDLNHPADEHELTAAFRYFENLP